MAPAHCKAVEYAKRFVLCGTCSRKHPRADKEAADFVLTHRITVPVRSDLTTKRI